ncbi:MAG: site-specific DNA-methyltransferase [Alphaproteobacteria bacterium]|nr:site-specific DNA-methyltransferase [Alphaproteobacteria bacterium]
MKNMIYSNNLDYDLSHLLDGDRTQGFQESGGLVETKKLVLSNREAGAYLYQANCLEIMDMIIAKHPQGCFDMIFADPPYFLSNGGITCQAGKMVKVDKGKWDKSQGADVNHAFNIEWLSRCQKLLKPNGTIWVSGTMHIIYSIGFALQQIGFKLLNDIAWEKPNPPPNLACRYFTHSTETVLWAAKNDKSKHYFNYDLMRKYNGDKQMKSVWRFTAPGSVEKEHGKHPTQKPLALLQRCIEAATKPGDFVFDPFAGSSTTGVAALRLNRKFCGVELEDAFIDLSIKRLNEVYFRDQPNLLTAV